MEQNTDDLLRDRLFQSIYEEFVGPRDPTSEELIDFSPSQRYNAGVLHPRGASISLEAEHDDRRPPEVEPSHPTGGEPSSTCRLWPSAIQQHLAQLTATNSKSPFLSQTQERNRL